MDHLQLFRLARKATSAAAGEGLVAITNKEDGEPQDTSNILEGVLFNRWFVVTYNLILLGFLLALTARHWSDRLLAFFKHGSASQSTARGHTSDGQTTNHLDYTNIKQLPNSLLVAHGDGERRPLLGYNKEQPPQTTSKIARFRSSIRSWLMYQSRPIPVVNKQLPDNLTTLVTLLFISLNVFYLFYNIFPKVWYTYMFADRAGLLFVANLPLLYLFSAKNCPFQRMTGFSYENLNIFHRRLGELVCFLALLHAGAFVKVWYDFLYPEGFTFWQLLALNVIWLGFSALACYEILYFTSLGSFRQSFYELFLALHVLLQIGGLSFLFFHDHQTRPYVGTALGIFIIDRVLYRVILARRTVKADLTILPDGNTVLLSANWALPTTRPSLFRRLVGQNMQSGWAPADHIFISVPSIPATPAMQAHPFTIASAAPGPGQTHAWLDLIIRARNGFSKDLLHHAEKHHRIDVAIDGPYGSHHALDMMRKSDIAVFVAGGSGIAVTLPIAWDLIMHGREERKQRVVLIWVVHDARHIEWIGQERFDELKERGLKIVMPEPTNKAGRPDMVRLMEEAVGEDVVGKKIGAVVSGPDSMNRQVNNTCAALVKKGLDVRVAVEKFGW
ncbi:Ferric reductase transmembrane component 1 [Elsinoe australis]|uniref:Ferric reductase transmembrane component 1 n=1 Tax=Elsinoe australis TaxID=40998 RepID=A0A2P7Z7L5_9PEZI|nr:Ferric reductase transmembrane component 1 [Elsinoe australis]